MSERKRVTKRPWRDPEDAPELTIKALEKARWEIGGRPVTRREGARALDEALKRGRPPVESPRKMVSLRLEPDVLAALRASGRGWQTRVNDLLREAVRKKRI